MPTDLRDNLYDDEELVSKLILNFQAVYWTIFYYVHFNII